MHSSPYRFDVDHAIDTWLRFLRFERTISDEDLDELEDHVRRDIAVLRRDGMGPEAAFREALHRVGDFATVGEAYRRVYFEKARRDTKLHRELIWNLTMLKNYLVTALRNLRSHAGIAFINVFGLAIGLASCILILLFVNYELSFDDLHSRSDQIFRLVEKQTFSGRSPEHIGLTMAPMGPALQDDYPEVIGYARFFNTGDALARYEDQNLYLGTTMYADQAVLDWFDFPLVKGDREAALNEPFSIVISESSAAALFGDEDPIGKHIEADDDDFVVTGVLGEMPSNSHLQFRALISYSTTLDNPRWEWMQAWRSNNLMTYVFLRPGTDREELEAKLDGFADKYLGDRADNYAFYLQPLPDIHLRSGLINYDNNWYKGDVDTIWSFGLIGLLVLIIACINFMNLATARATTRAREVGMRKVVGAHRSQLILQFMSESAIMAALATFLALVIVALVGPHFSDFIGRDANLSLFDEPRTLPAVLVVALITAVVSGAYPSFVLSRVGSAGIVKGAGTRRMGSSRLRKVLVVAQFAITVLLINATVLAALQFRYMRTKNLGYSIDQVVSVWIPGVIRQQYRAFREELVKDASVVDATVSRQRLGDFVGETSFTFEGADPDQLWISPYNGVDYNFLDFYGLELLAGRAFSPEVASDTSEAGAFIINEALARKLGWDEPVGKRFGLGDENENLGEVIGVVKDFHFYSLHHEIEPLILFPQPEGAGRMYVRLKSQSTEAGLEHVAAVWKEFAPDWPFEFTFMDDLFADMYKSDQQISRLFGVFSMIAIFIACLGLFGLAAFTAARRTREIGVRKALGASASRVFLLLSGEFTRLVGLAILLSVPIAYIVLSRWLDSFPYHVSLSWGVLASGGAAAIVIAWLSVGLQSFRAARLNPVDALRIE